MINTFSLYTKGLQSLHGYNFMGNIGILNLGEVSLLLADVKHSQKLTATLLHPRIAAEWNGSFVCTLPVINCPSGQAKDAGQCVQ